MTEKTKYNKKKSKTDNASWFKRPAGHVDIEVNDPHNVVVNGQKKSLSKSSQYFIDMLTKDNEEE